MPRLLLTNDDGIDSIGLHVLARAMREHGDVVIVAPDSEYSGAGAALGALHLMQPEVRRAEIDGIDEAWAVNGPPGLCVMLMRLGVFGPRRPGRRRHQPGCQRRARGVPLGDGRRHAHGPQRRDQRRRRQPGRDRVRRRGPGLGRDDRRSALGRRRRMSASRVVEAVLAIEHRRAGRGQRQRSEPARRPDRAAGATPKSACCPRAPSSRRRWTRSTGREGVFAVQFHWGDAIELPPETDGGAIERDEVTISYLSRLEAQPRTDLAGGRRGARRAARGARRSYMRP